MEKELEKRLFLVELCRQIAHEAHRGQTRRDGKTPYIEHIEKVVELVGEDEELQCIAWLHDVIEDSGYTMQDLYDLKIPAGIVYIVDILTHRKNHSYINYIDNINHSDERAAIVKIADIVANLSDKPTNKQVTKYYKALCILNGN